MLCFAFVFSGKCLKPKKFPSFKCFFSLSPDFLKFFLQFQLKVNEFVCENKFIVLNFKMSMKKKIYIGNKEILDKEICLMFVVLFVYFSI